MLNVCHAMYVNLEVPPAMSNMPLAAGTENWQVEMSGHVSIAHSFAWLARRVRRMKPLSVFPHENNQITQG